jgi:bla regulator protein BlaR1
MEFQWLNFLPANWVNALYITLFHSLWIGLVMALIAGIIVIATKNSRPALRYNLLTTLLGIFSLSMMFVFYQSLNKVNLLSTYLNPEVSNRNQFFKLNVVSDINNVLSTLGTYANQLLLIWFGVIVIKAIKLMMGIQGVHHLKKTKVFDAGAYWQNKVNELSHQLYIKQSVQILQSGIAKIPMVIGHFKPTILMPIGMLNHLSLTEVEAILSHELAHIKRRDYLVNILQNILEVLFFFNPAVLWISKMIKDERENCCDDLAISCTNDKNGYLKALVSCQEFNLNATGFAMSMANGKGQLIARIRRIAFDKKASLGDVEKMILSLSLLFVFALSVAFTLSEKPNSVAKLETKKEQNMGEDKVKEMTTLKPVQPLKPTIATTAKKETKIANNRGSLVIPSINNNIIKPTQPNQTCDPVVPVQFVNPPVSKTVSTSVSTTSTTVRIDGKITVDITYHNKDARNEIKRDMLNDSLIIMGENPSYVLNRNEMLVNGIKQDPSTHRKYKNKYITTPDTQYRIGS